MELKTKHSSNEFESLIVEAFWLADYSLLVFSWNDIFPSLPQTAMKNDLVGQTFTFNGGGDLVNYQDNDSFSGSFGDYGFVDNQITGTIDGVSVNESLVNPEYAYEIKDSSGTTVGNMYAISKNTPNLVDIEAFTFDFQPQGGETYRGGRGISGQSLSWIA